MKNLRRLVVTLAVLLLAVLCLTATVQAADIVESGTCGDNLTWTLDDEGTLTISGTGAMEEYGLWQSPWAYLDVRKVVVENGVTVISYAAFRTADRTLESVSLPESLKEIGSHAFTDEKITEIVIPDSVTSIGIGAFKNCDSLKDVTLPNKLEVLPGSIFEDCESLESIVIPESVKTIDSDAFKNCESLVDITFPSQLEKMVKNAFSGCDSLQEVVLPDSVSSIGFGAFSECSNLKTVYLPNNLTIIPNSAFEECTSLARIELPESVTEIEDSAFEGCSALVEITLPSTLKKVRYRAFQDCVSLEVFVLPDSVTVMEERVFAGCSNLQLAYLPTNLKKVPDSTFQNCSSLVEVYLPAKLKTIEYGAFFGCNSLTNLYFPGTEEQLAQIEVADGNDPVYYANVYLVTAITEQPEDAYAVDGATVKFSTDTNRDGCTFQWYYLAPNADEWKPCKESSAKKKTLTITAKEKLDGYYYCCEITDPYGNVGETRAARLTIVEPPKITTQPKSVAVPEGTTAKVTVKAKGDGLTYQWYIKNAGKDKFSKSSTTSASYSVKMSEKADGREVYCVVKDQYGNTVKSKTVTLYMGNGAKITTQPQNTAAAEGKVAKATVKATGDGLTYQWYIKNAGSSKFGKSSATSATYSCKMSETTDGRQAYCVITDQYGTSVKTKTVTFYVGNGAKITTQPQSAAAPEGTVAKATVKATGDGLSYQWYIKNVGMEKFGKSSATGATYSVKMSESTDGRQAYCVITDQYGISVQTKTVTFYVGNGAKITSQPQSAAAPEGTIARATVKATGDGLTYQWYIKNVGSSKFGKSSVTSATYSCKMSETTDGRQAYCVITDQYGTSVKTKTVTFYIGNPIEIIEQPVSVSAENGAVVKTTVKATGDDLSYQWYIKNVGMTKFGKSSATGATYSVKVSESTDGRQAYCVITDKYGASVQTETVTITMQAENAHTHTPQTVEILPTCTTPGQIQTVCAECNEVLETAEKANQPALGHDWVETSNTATCISDGTKTSQCSRCSESTSESVAATGHVSTHVETQKATCTEDGWEKTICDQCGTQIGSTSILAARGEHSYETAVVADAAKEYSDHCGKDDYDEYLAYSDIVCDRCKDCYVIDEDSFAYRYSAEEVTQMMLGYVNQLRKENGLTELAADTDQISLANTRAEEIAINFDQTTEHRENIAQATTLGDCVMHFYNTYLESADQKANMLAEDITTFGCAIYYLNGAVYCVQVFA